MKRNVGEKFCKSGFRNAHVNNLHSNIDAIAAVSTLIIILFPAFVSFPRSHPDHFLFLFSHPLDIETLIARGILSAHRYIKVASFLLSRKFKYSNQFKFICNYLTRAHLISMSTRNLTFRYSLRSFNYTLAIIVRVFSVLSHISFFLYYLLKYY